MIMGQMGLVLVRVGGGMLESGVGEGGECHHKRQRQRRD